MLLTRHRVWILLVHDIDLPIMPQGTLTDAGEEDIKHGAKNLASELPHHKLMSSLPSLGSLYSFPLPTSCLVDAPSAFSSGLPGRILLLHHVSILYKLLDLSTDCDRLEFVCSGG